MLGRVERADRDVRSLRSDCGRRWLDRRHWRDCAAGWRSGDRHSAMPAPPRRGTPAPRRGAAICCSSPTPTVPRCRAGSRPWRSRSPMSAWLAQRVPILPVNARSSPASPSLSIEDRYDRMTDVESIDFVDTYSAAYRRDIFLANEGFDSTFPTASIEDQELSFRLTEKGYRLVFAPAAKVLHHHNHTLSAYIRRKFFIGYWKVLCDAAPPRPGDSGLAYTAGSEAPDGTRCGDSHRVPSRRPGELGQLGIERAGTGGWSTCRPGFSDSPRFHFWLKVWRRDRGVTLPAAGLLVGACVRLGSRIRHGTGPFSWPPRREPDTDLWLAAGCQAPHGCRPWRGDPDRDGAADGGHRSSGEARFARPDLLPPDARGAGWPALPHLQVPHDGGPC